MGAGNEGGVGVKAGARDLVGAEVEAGHWAGRGDKVGTGDEVGAEDQVKAKYQARVAHKTADGQWKVDNFFKEKLMFLFYMVLDIFQNQDSCWIQPFRLYEHPCQEEIEREGQLRGSTRNCREVYGPQWTYKYL